MSWAWEWGRKIAMIAWGHLRLHSKIISKQKAINDKTHYPQKMMWFIRQQYSMCWCQSKAVLHVIAWAPPRSFLTPKVTECGSHDGSDRPRGFWTHNSHRWIQDQMLLLKGLLTGWQGDRVTVNSLGSKEHVHFVCIHLLITPHPPALPEPPSGLW